MIRKLIRIGALAGVMMVAPTACDLEVENPNDPDTDIVLASPLDAENLLASYWRRWHSGVYGNTLGNIRGMANVMSLENYSSLANNCQNSRGGIPRPANDNNVSNVCQGEQQRVYFIMGEVGRVATNILKAASAPSFSIGGGDADRKIRMQAFAQFLRGLSLGYTALFYDSAAVVDSSLAGDDPGVLMGYREVMDSALSALDAAIALTNSAGSLDIPDTWIPTSYTLDQDGFIELIRSYKARFRANVARTPTERAAVDWAAVIADATNGITQDYDNITSTTQGPFDGWADIYGGKGLWHQMPPFIIGMADNQGANYEAWIALPLEQRGITGPFFMQTSDLRFPQGATRGAQQADFGYTSCEGPADTCKRYFVNRPGSEDQAAGVTWGQSQYDHVRWRYWDVSGDAGQARNGARIYISKTEMDMLAAEGYIRPGAQQNLALARTLIDLTRTAGVDGDGNAQGGGLASVTTGLTGGGCIPEVPVSAGHAGGGTVVCAGDAPAHPNAPGDRGLFEAMKYEKRIETAYTHFGAWFLDNRGWGDMPEGTPLHWAVPYQDLQARQRGIYSIGGSQAPSDCSAGPGPSCQAAGPSTYGW